MHVDPEHGWLDDYSRRFAQALDDSVRAGLAGVERWARRSREDPEWTAESVTADVIAEWEQFTPLLGRWLDLGLEAAQRPFAGSHEEPDDPPEPAPAPDGSVPGRVREYGELAEKAAAKFRSGSYRSPDLLDDWFTFSSKAARDLTTASTSFWVRSAADEHDPGRSEPPDDEGVTRG